MKTILLVDDHQLIYYGFSLAMRGKYNLDYASDPDEALIKLKNNNYYAVILDISLGERKGFEIINNIPKKSYIFMLSMHKSSRYIKMAKDFGADGYFLKDESLEYLLNAMNTPQIHRPFIMSPSLEEEFNELKNDTSSNYEKLSPREQQVFYMLAEDLSYVEIAKRLGISKKTVNNHRDHIMNKLEISTQGALVKEAVRLGIISV